MARTTLAHKTGLNYSVLIRYLGLLESLVWLEFSRGQDRKKSMLKINQRGIHFLLAYKRFQSTESSSMKQVRVDVAKLSSDFDSELSSINDSTLLAEIGSEMHNDDNDCSNNRNNHASRIMIIDDDPDCLLIYKLFLSEAGYYDVESFTNSREAFRTLCNHKTSYYNLIITDIRMQELNGLQLYQEVRRADKEINFMFLTALNGIEEVLSIMPDLKGVPVIQKPVGRKQLLEIVEATLASCRFAHVDTIKSAFEISNNPYMKDKTQMTR